MEQRKIRENPQFSGLQKLAKNWLAINQINWWILQIAVMDFPNWSKKNMAMTHVLAPPMFFPMSNQAFLISNGSLVGTKGWPPGNPDKREVNRWFWIEPGGTRATDIRSTCTVGRSLLLGTNQKVF